MYSDITQMNCIFSLWSTDYVFLIVSFCMIFKDDRSCNRKIIILLSVRNICVFSSLTKDCEENTWVVSIENNKNSQFETQKEIKNVIYYKKYFLRRYLEFERLKNTDISVEKGENKNSSQNHQKNIENNNNFSKTFNNINIEENDASVFFKIPVSKSMKKSITDSNNKFEKHFKNRLEFLRQTNPMLVIQLESEMKEFTKKTI